jgi:hypothetical protein
MENINENEYGLRQGELAEGFFEEDRDFLFTAMRNRGVSQEIQDRILEQIIESVDATDRHESVDVWLMEAGINNSEDIVTDWLMTHLTLEEIREHFEPYGGLNYSPINPVQDQAQG